MTKTTNQWLGEAIAALGTTEFEPALYAWLGQVCDIDNVTMLAYFEDRGPKVFFSHANEPRVFERLNSDYVRGIYLLDPIYALHTKRAEEGFYRLRDVAPDQFRRNEYFATYYRRTTLTDEVDFLAHPAPGVSVTICVGRDASSARQFSARDLSRLREVSPIVIPLASRHWSRLRSEAGQDDRAIVQALRDRLKEERGIPLSPRQGEIAFLILRGHSSASIGLLLGISPQTVKVIRKQLYRKCAITSQAELFSLLTPYLLGL
ncbi:helix-turn-helix transcriptional regulator [Alisedimentitalea sp. MJ-SS2]|uniref:helix-turn-helix transcriptional regulator n=1 Tax=Aliisedimentitalea sp. MJ-SS2 TaxID=3049795 RepID=UPI00290F2869|nr:helix-turn-helix transcriptional regulator [Alisedimentitalea sp. MJ-SS2]MDU8929913.1 helix-turn-helix transcriptional regulator [Alisedimentitalea sp. MJ-SS2]